jgi:hypothetical protein
MYWPDNPIYFFGIFPIKAKWLVLGLIGLSLFYAASGGQSGVAHLAHLGGAAAAFLYLKSPWAPGQWGNVARKPRRASASPGGGLLGGWPFKRGAGTRGDEKRARAPHTVTAAPAPPRAAPRRGPPTDIDRILDKISEQGIASLTDDELRRLREASKQR